MLKKEETQSSTNTKANAILNALKDINSVTNNDDVKKYFDEFVKSITEASDDKFNDVLNKSLQKLIFDVDNKLGNTDFVKLINAIHKGTKYTDVFDWPLRGSTVTLEGKSVKEIANSTNISVDDSKRYKVKHLSTPVMGYSDDGKDYIIQAKRATIELTDQEASSDNTGKKKTVEKDTKDGLQIPEDRVSRLDEVLGETLKLIKPLDDKKYWTTFPELYDKFKELYDDTIKRFEHMRGKLNSEDVNDVYFENCRELAEVMCKCESLQGFCKEIGLTSQLEKHDIQKIADEINDNGDNFAYHIAHSMYKYRRDEYYDKHSYQVQQITNDEEQTVAMVNKCFKTRKNPIDFDILFIPKAPGDTKFGMKDFFNQRGRPMFRKFYSVYSPGCYGIDGKRILLEAMVSER